MSIRKAASWAVAGQYYSFSLYFIASIILARYFIDPAELGLFSISFAAISLIAFLQDFGIARYISGERELTDEKRRTAFTLSLSVAWLIAAICVALAWPLADFYGDERLLPISLVIAGSYFLVPFAIVPQALRQRELDFKSSAMIDMGSATANAAVSLYLGWQGHGAMALAWGAFAQQAGRAIVAQWRAGWTLPWPPRVANPGRVFSFGGTNTVLVTTQMITERSPELLLGRMLDASSVGLFARGAGLAMQLRLLIVGAVSGVFFPAFRKIRDEGKPLGDPYILVAGTFTAIMWPAMAGLAILSEPVINLLYGEKWIASAPLLFWLALAQMCYVTVPLNSDLPILLDEKRDLIIRFILDMSLGLALLIAAIPYGLEGIAISRLVHGVAFILNFGQFLHRTVGFSLRSWLVVQLKSAIATLFAIVPTFAFYEIASGPSEAGFLQILASASCGALLWLVGLRLVRHPAMMEAIVHIEPLRRRFAGAAS